MKVLVLGDDGRAHALVWKLFNSTQANEIVCIPGNGGTAQLAPQVEDANLSNPAELARWAFQEGIDTIVPASSDYLQHGLMDELHAFQIGVCSPPQAAIALEQSRCYAKEFLLRHNLPTAKGRPFQDLATAERYLAAQPLPIVVKADHRAAGEGIYQDRYAALTALREFFESRPLEGENNGVVIESFLSGTRLSLSAITDGTTVIPLLPTWIYDRMEEGDKGTVAPGMGAHTSTSTYARKLTEYLRQNLLLPIVTALNQHNFAYKGFIGVDCIITDQGPRITGMRCAMRDMESQVVLPRMEDDILPLIQAAINHRLDTVAPPRWRDEASVGIALVAQGYPHHFPTGGPIEGLSDIDQGVLVFHNKTHNALGLRYDTGASRGGDPLASLMRAAMGGSGKGTAFTTTGGHVLAVVALAATLNGARGRAIINAERITFPGRYFRGDIGQRELR